MTGETLTFRKRPWVFQHQGVLTTGHYDAFFTPVRDETGVFTSVFAMVLEAQADQVALPDLSASEYATAPDALWILDYQRMRLTYASPALERLMGEGRAEVQANFKRWFDLVHPDDREAVTMHLIRSAAGETLVTQYRIVRASDGNVVIVRHTSFPMQGRDRAPGQVAGLVQDVTAIELANTALLEEKERYRTMVEGIASLTWRSSDEGLWTWAGPQWLDYTGQTQEQSHGWGWLDAVHPEDRQCTMQAWHQARPHGMLDAMFRLLRASDQSWRWFQTRSMPRRIAPSPDEPAGQIVEWLGSTTDIHDLKLLQERQASMIAELERRTASMNGVVNSLGGTVPQQGDPNEGDSTIH